MFQRGCTSKGKEKHLSPKGEWVRMQSQRMWDQGQLRGGVQVPKLLSLVLLTSQQGWHRSHRCEPNLHTPLLLPQAPRGIKKGN